MFRNDNVQTLPGSDVNQPTPVLKPHYCCKMRRLLNIIVYNVNLSLTFFQTITPNEPMAQSHSGVAYAH